MGVPVAVGYGGGQTSHQSVSRPYGEQRSIVQSKALGAAHASVSQVDNSKGLAEIQPALGANRPVAVGHAAVLPVAHHAVAHAVHAPVAHAVHAPVAHAVHAPVIAHVAPVVHAAPAYHAPAVKVSAAYKEPAYPDEVSPYTFTYAVADDYSNAAFNADETSDGAGTVSGSYSVALPDGRTQHVKYHSNEYDGYVAEVTYEGTAVYPDTPAYAAPVVKAAPAYAAPVVAHAPVVAAGYHARPAGQVSHQSVSKPFQGEHRSTTQSKAFGAAVAAVADSPNRLHGAKAVVAHPVAHAVAHPVAHTVIG